jgi:hypothetical protein
MMVIDVARTRANEEGRKQIAAWVDECRRGESDRLADALDVAKQTTLRPVEVMEMFASSREIARRPKLRVVEGAKPPPFKFRRFVFEEKKEEPPQGGIKRGEDQPQVEAVAATPNVADGSEAADGFEPDEIDETAVVRSEKVQGAAKAIALAATGGQALAVVPAEPANEELRKKLAAGIWPEGQTADEAVREINGKHAVISNLGGKCVTMEWVPSMISPGQKELSYQSFQAFRERYANKYVFVPNGKGGWTSAPFAPIWLSHPQRRQYEGLDLVANGPPVLPNGYLNLWKGWGVEPRKGSWRLMQRHIAEVLANGHQGFEDYLIRSSAWKFQNPGLPPEVLLALLGGKGVGKGAWGYVSMLIFGTHGLQIFSTDHLIGKHNQHLQNKLFLFLDEAIWAGDKDADRVLKGLVTEKSMFIEPKNVNGFQWPNRLGIYMSGNDKWIVPASHDERRYAVNKVSERYKQDKSYFVPLFEEINNGGAGAMLYDLLNLDLDGWHPRDNVPQTKALLDQKMLGLTGLELWYVHLLNIGELPWPNKKNPRWCNSSYLLESAVHYHLRNRYLAYEELGSFLKEMGCTHKSDGKAWGWIFPPLNEAREDWAKRAGGNWDWLAADIKDWAEKPQEDDPGK